MKRLLVSFCGAVLVIALVLGVAYLFESTASENPLDNYASVKSDLAKAQPGDFVITLDGEKRVNNLVRFNSGGILLQAGPNSSSDSWHIHDLAPKVVQVVPCATEESARCIAVQAGWVRQAFPVPTPSPSTTPAK